jgi:hypothetical protein
VPQELERLELLVLRVFKVFREYKVVRGLLARKVMQGYKELPAPKGVPDLKVQQDLLAQRGILEIMVL